MCSKVSAEKETEKTDFDLYVARCKQHNIRLHAILSFLCRSAFITLYEHAAFKGRTLQLTGDASNFVSLGFNDIVSAVQIEGGTWTLYQHVDYKGKSVTLGPGSYDYDVIKARIGNDCVSSAKCASIVLYEHAGFKGRELKLSRDAPNFCDLQFNDILSSVRVTSGTWTLYQHVDYQGTALQLSEGAYDIQEIRGKMGNDVVSSAKVTIC